MYSPSTKGFYKKSIHGDSIPKDSVGISHDLFLEAICKGMDISISKNGDAILVPAISTVMKSTYCTPAQGLVALFSIKRITEDDIINAIDSMEDEVEKYTAQIAFKHTKIWEKNSSAMSKIANLLKLSKSDLDELFDFASTVPV